MTTIFTGFVLAVLFAVGLIGLGAIVIALIHKD